MNLPTGAVPRAIPTTHNGFRCRSRLEARWMIFFEEMDFEFWYEPEGFVLCDGTRYLPDFFFPQIRMYGEVKPELPSIAELAKAENLCRTTGKHCILLIGPPDFKAFDALFFYDGDLEPTDVCLDIEVRRQKWYIDEHRLYASCAGMFTKESDFTERYRTAVQASRSARFDGRVS